MDTFAYDVFLSHSSKDKVVIRKLARRLKDDGLRVWFDEWIIGPGDLIGLQIERGLEQSRTLVLAMSANAFNSDWVTLERHTTLFRDPTNSERRLIPLRIDDAQIKETLSQFAYVDWRQRSEQQYEKLLSVCRPASIPPIRPAQIKIWQNRLGRILTSTNELAILNCTTSIEAMELLLRSKQPVSKQKSRGKASRSRTAKDRH
jgi:hypothetical protein